MLKIEIVKKATYGSLLAGDVFSWPLSRPEPERAIGLKLSDGFVWLKSARSPQTSDLMFTPECDMHKNLPVNVEGNLQITLGDSEPDSNNKVL